jgi:hypothetical protein
MVSVARHSMLSVAKHLIQHKHSPLRRMNITIKQSSNLRFELHFQFYTKVLKKHTHGYSIQRLAECESSHSQRLWGTQDTLRPLYTSNYKSVSNGQPGRLTGIYSHERKGIIWIVIRTIGFYGMHLKTCVIHMGEANQPKNSSMIFVLSCQILSLR